MLLLYNRIENFSRENKNSLQKADCFYYVLPLEATACAVETVAKGVVIASASAVSVACEEKKNDYCSDEDPEESAVA